MTVLRLDPSQTTYRLLGPWPDGPEYVDAAVHFLETGRFRIHVAGEAVPSRYPFGYSLLAAGAIWLGADPLTAPLRVNQCAGLTLLLGLFALLASQGRPAAGGLAALLLAAQPSFVVLSRAPMSEVPTALATFCAAVLLVLFTLRRRPVYGLAGAALLGLTVCFRLSNLLLAGMLVAAVWSVRRHSRVRVMAACVAAYLCGLLPLLLYQWLAFGAPWRTGYGFWLGELGKPWRAFSMENLPGQLLLIWNEIVQQELGPTTAGLYGAGSYVGPAFVILVLLAARGLFRDPSLRLFAFAAAGYFASLLFYYFDDFRLFFPILVLAVPVCAIRILDLMRSGWRQPAKALLAVLVLSAILGWPGRRSALDAGDLLRTPSLYWPVPEWDLIAKLNDLRHRDLVIFTDMNPPYVHALTESRPIVVPLEEGHDYSHNPAAFVFEKSHRQELMRKALSRGSTVLTVIARGSLEKWLARKSPPPGASWRIVERNSHGGGIARLELAAEGEQKSPE